jgi:hypothetical protein
MTTTGVAENIDPQPDETGAQPVASHQAKSRKALSRVIRELTDPELASPGVQKMLIEELEEAQEKSRELESYRDRYHEEARRAAVLEIKAQRSRAWEILSTISIAMGTLIMGHAPTLWRVQPSGWLALICGGVLIVIGIIAMAKRS